MSEPKLAISGTAAQIRELVNWEVLRSMADKRFPVPSPAVKAVDPTWFQRQVALRRKYIADLAEALGLDPAEAIRRLGGPLVQLTEEGAVMGDVGY